MRVDRYFLNPWALALALLAGGIVLLYILKLKRIRVRVSSTLLWERSVHDFKANAPWQKLRRNLLMLLQIAALILLALALARPFIFGTALTGGRSVIVLDTSASMLAADESPDRLGKAMAAAEKMISDLSRRDEAMLIAAGPTPRVLSSFSTNKPELSAALRKARDEAGGVADMDAALRLASSVTAGNKARVVVFSDGAIPDLDPFTATDLRVAYYPVGRGSDNIGIVSAGARRNPFTNRYELFVALHNYYPQAKTAEVTISVGDNPLDVREVQLNAGQRSEVVMTDLPYIEQPIKVEIDKGDPLGADDTAYIQMPQRMEFKVAICAQGESILLRKALSGLPDTKVYEYAGGKLTGPSEEQAVKINVWVIDGDAAGGMDPEAGYLFLNTSKHDYLPVIPGPEVSADFNADPPVIPSIVGLDRGSELLRFTSLSDLRLKVMRRCQLQPWAKTVVDASEGPLIVTGTLQGQRTVYLAFDIYQSDFPLRASFPIFLANTIRFLAQSATSATNLAVPAGQRVDLLAPPLAASVKLTSPTKQVNSIPLGSREFTLGNTSAVGLYELDYLDSAGKVLNTAVVPVSLVNEQESNIAPAKTIRFKNADEALAGGDIPKEIMGTQKVRVNREFYTWLLLLVLAIMGLEWYLYHTRAL
jgi:Ca-activated chloride channel homolog